MNRSWHCLAAAVLALVLAVPPTATAIGPADRNPQDVDGTWSGWLTVLTDRLAELIGDREGDPASRAAMQSTSPENPPQGTDEPPANSESDRGPGWDPGG